MGEQLEVSVSSEPRVKIIGIGGAGTHALAQIAATDLKSVPLSAMHTHARVLQQSEVSHRILIGVDRTHGLGTGGDAELARVMAENESAVLREALQGFDLIFLVAGMGGGTGTGVTPVIARLARESGALVVAIVTTPYEFEGPRRQKQASLGLQLLRPEADAVICVPNQKTSKLLAANTTVLEAFAFTNRMLADAMLGIYQMLTRPGLINVDFAYLSSVLRGRHVESALATARAQGENRAREVIEKLLANPLLDQGQVLAESEQVLASVVASRDLTMEEINKISEQLGRHMEQRNVIIGTAIDPVQSDFISVTLIASKKGREIPEKEAEFSKRSESSLEGTSFLEGQSGLRPAPRFVAPPPETNPQNTRHLLETAPTSRKNKIGWKQEMLALEIVSRGRFEKSEPTIHHGADLDVPTYIRRGIPLN